MMCRVCSAWGLETARASNFCRDNDKFPDIDRLIAYLSADSEKLKLSVGLGEFPALKGEKFTAKILSRLKDIPARFVLLLRFIAPHVRNMAGDDRRLYERGLVDDYERWLYFVMLIQNQRGQDSYITYAAGHAENFTRLTYRALFRDSIYHRSQTLLQQKGQQ